MYELPTCGKCGSQVILNVIAELRNYWNIFLKRYQCFDELFTEGGELIVCVWLVGDESVSRLRSFVTECLGCLEYRIKEINASAFARKVLFPSFEYLRNIHFVLHRGF